MKKYFKYSLVILTNIIFAVGSSFYSNWMMNYSLYGSKEELSKFITSSYHNSYLFGIGLCLFFILFLSIIIGDVFLASGFFLAVAGVLSFVNYFKMEARNAPFYPEEIKMAKESKALAQMVDKQAISQLILELVLLVVLIVILYVIKRKFKFVLPRKFNYWLRGISLIFTLVVLFQFPQINQKETKVNEWVSHLGIDVSEWGWNQPGNYRANGFVLGFVYNFLPRNVIDKPENYSKQAIESIVNKYQVDLPDSKENKKNIVFILSESFTDPYDLNASIQFEEDSYSHSSWSFK